MKKCFCFSETQANLIFFINSKPRLQEGRVSVLDIMWDSVAVRALRVMWRCLELVELQNPIFHCCNTRNMEIPEKLFLLINRAREIKRGEPCGQNSRWGLPQKTFLKLIAATKAKKRPHSKVLESISTEAQKPKTFRVATFYAQKLSGRSAQNHLPRQAYKARFCLA